jgi:hypothetical protein
MTNFAFRGTSQAGEPRSRGSVVPTAPPPPSTRQPPKSDANRHKGGAACRHRYTCLQKSEVLSFYDRCHQGIEPGSRTAGRTPGQMCTERFGVPHGTLSGWLKEANAIHYAAAEDIKKRLKVMNTSVTPRALYPLIGSKLFAVFTERRRRGRVSRTWMQTRAQLLFKDHYPDSKIVFKASRAGAYTCPLLSST